MDNDITGCPQCGSSNTHRTFNEDEDIEIANNPNIRQGICVVNGICKDCDCTFRVCKFPPDTLYCKD